MQKPTRHRSLSLALPRAEILALLAGALLIAYFALNSSMAPMRSVEVSFTDSSKSGMQIVPASCASPPPPTSGDTYGHIVAPGTSNGRIGDVTGKYFCVTNSGSPTYFVPTKTDAEAHAFFIAVPSLPGLSKWSPPATDPI